MEIIRKLQLEKAEFNNMIKQYRRVRAQDAEVWDLPPIDFSVVNYVIGNVNTVS